MNIIEKRTWITEYEARRHEESSPTTIAARVRLRRARIAGKVDASHVRIAMMKPQEIHAYLISTGSNK
jgi:hypothetical protein